MIFGYIEIIIYECKLATNITTYKTSKASKKNTGSSSVTQT